MSVHSSNFDFLKSQYPLLANLGTSAEHYLYNDPGSALVKLRILGEKTATIICNENSIRFPVRTPSFHERMVMLKKEDWMDRDIINFLNDLKDKGNEAAHEASLHTDKNKKALKDAKENLEHAFLLGKWLVETYATNAPADLDGLHFKLPPNIDVSKQLEELETQRKDLEARYQQAQEELQKVTRSAEELRLFQERSLRAARKIELSEEATRRLIDKQLQQAQWEADTEGINFRKKGTKPEKGRNLAIAEWPIANGWADYALFRGFDLVGIVEAKKHSKDVVADLAQAQRYAKNADTRHDAQLLGQWNGYKVPFMLATNGRPYHPQLKDKSGIWFLDGRKSTNHPRPLQNWYTPDGLYDLYERDIEAANLKLKAEPMAYLADSSGLGLREYQLNAIEAVERKVMRDDQERRALVAMATGTGKTRTIIGLCYRLLKSKRFRRILFLVDRRVLGKQAADSFNDVKIEDFQTFAQIYDLKEIGKSRLDDDTRLHFATVQSMAKRIDDNNAIRPQIDDYDCIIVDEAHRGYTLDREIDEDEIEFKDQRDFQSKYRLVLDYFDAFRIALTATPALHTTEIFGDPVYRYSYRQAVIDGYLIDHEPPYLFETELSKNGIHFPKGGKVQAYNRRTNQSVNIEHLEDEVDIDIDGFNRQVITESFNRTIAKELVKYFLPDDPAKTLIFAATDEHADTVVRLLKEEYVEAGLDVDNEAICKITGSVDKVQELVNRFKNERFPCIVVTVDLLTTGVDVPRISNLVFLRRVRSRILYEQMLGRATRRADDIGKEVFRIFDPVRLYEAIEDVSDMKPVVADPNLSFEKLLGELATKVNEKAAPEVVKKTIDQLIAKLQRKKSRLKHDLLDEFKSLSGITPEEFIHLLQQDDLEAVIGEVKAHSYLFGWLDRTTNSEQLIFVSDHEDTLLSVQRGYGKGTRPEDYIESFKQYLQENRNKIAGLQIVCTRPKELTRTALKELRMELSNAGYRVAELNTAWKESKNEEITADIIAYIRALVLGNALVSTEDRVKNAMKKVRAYRSWTVVQKRWLDLIEKQLIRESVLTREDFEQPPFKNDGGFTRVDKILDNQLENVISMINDNMYGQVS